MTNEKKAPPKKLTKAEAEKQLAAEKEAAAKELEKESGLPASFMVKVKETGEEFNVSREYYLKNKKTVELVGDDA